MIILFQLYQAACVLLPFAAVFAALGPARRKAFGRGAGGIALPLLFALYFCAVLYVTGAGTLYNILARGGVEINPQQINLVPFSEAGVVDSVLNVLLMAPLGFLVPLAWPKCGGLAHVALLGAALSLTIELSQLLNNRSTDVDDLILNTLGAVLGWLACKAFVRIVKLKPAQRASFTWEPALYIGGMFAGNFLLYNDMGLARLLYGF